MNRTSLFWSLQPPQGRLSYMFGTMHVRDERVYKWCEFLYPFIRQSDCFVSEMDLSQQISMAGEPHYSLRAQFHSDTYEKMRRQLLKSFGVDVATIDQLHPLLIMSALSVGILGQDHFISLDEHLWQYAARYNIELKGLESAREQMDILHQIAPDSLYKQLKDISQRPSALRRFTLRTIDVYLQNDVHRLYRLTKSSMHQLRKDLIYTRNLIMAERIVDFEKEKCHFIAVGAGHLSGQKGLISLLKRRGYGIRPVSYTEGMSSSDLEGRSGKIS